MPLLDEKPTAQYIKSMRQHLEDVWRSTWKDWEKRDEYYFRTFSLWPSGVTRPQYHPARATQIVDSAVDHQLSGEPQVHRFPAGEGEDHQTRADGVECYLRAVLQESALMEPIPTWKAVQKNLVHLGYAVVEGPVLDMTERAKKPREHEGEEKKEYERRLALYQNEMKTWMPFRIRVPHPSTVLLDPEQKRPRFGVSHIQKRSQDLYELTKKKHSRRSRDADIWPVGDNPFALIECDEYWTQHWHALMASGGDALIIEKNTWGFVPFAHGFAGWGQLPTNPDFKIDGPLYLTAGLLTAVMETLKLQAQAVSGRQQALIVATFNMLGTRMDPAELAAMLGRSDIVGPLQDPGDVWWLALPQLPGWTFEGEKWLDHDIELATMSRSLAGHRDVGVSTVGQEAILDTAAGRKFISVNNQAEHLATVVASNILRLVDMLGETLYCRGYTVKPSDIEHDYSVAVEFNVVDPVLQLQRQELGLREMEAGALSLPTYWAGYSQLEDASGERKRLLKDKVYRHPVVEEAMALEVAREMGLGDILERQEGAAAGGNGNQPVFSPLLGPDGMPMLGGSMGQAPIDGAGQTGNPLRQGLTPNTVAPGRVNPLAFRNRR